MVETVMWLIVHLRYIRPYKLYGGVVGEGRNLGGNGSLQIDVLSWCVLEGKEQNRQDLLVASVYRRH
jgi:hypothetical protein